MPTTKTITVRLDDDQHQNLTLMARAGGISATRLMRDLIDEAWERAVADPKFGAQIERIHESERRVLERAQAAAAQAYSKGDDHVV